MEQQLLHFNQAPKDAFCPHCHQRVTSRTERLTPGLVRALVKFISSVANSADRKAHIQKNCDLSTYEFCNFSKLAFFSLVEKTEEAGVWRLTETGERFAMNQARIPKAVEVYRKSVISKNAETLNIYEAMKGQPFWLQKQDYVARSAQI